MIVLALLSSLLFFAGSSWEGCRRWWHIPDAPHDPGDHVAQSSGLTPACDPGPRHPCPGHWR